MVPLLTVAVLLLLVGGWAFKTFSSNSAVARPMTLLLLGVDEGRTRPDVIIVAHIDPDQGLVNLLSIPRDTLVDIPCAGLSYCITPDKVNHAHVYGGKQGPEVITRSLENLLHIKIDHYGEIDYEGFEKIVDALGGVDIVIDKPMDYEDPYANPPLRIHFKASTTPQHLNGADALRYVRFRNDGLGDIGRIERTKKFFFSLSDTARKNGSILKLPALINALWPYVHTDVDASSAIALARIAPKVSNAHIGVAMLPGTDKILDDGRWVWLPDEKESAGVVDRMIRHPAPPAEEKR